MEENLLIEYKPGFYRELTKEEWFCYYYVKLNEIYDTVNWYDLPVVGNPKNDSGPEYLHDTHYRRLCLDWFKDVNVVKGTKKDIEITDMSEKILDNVEKMTELMRNTSTFLEMTGKNVVIELEHRKRHR